MQQRKLVLLKFENRPSCDGDGKTRHERQISNFKSMNVELIGHLWKSESEWATITVQKCYPARLKIFQKTTEQHFELAL
ncbi:MAG: hypothetical protein VB140_02415 [Burkholderia sp.]